MSRHHQDKPEKSGSTIKRQVTRLPAISRETGDPVSENPFLSNDARHSVWKRATLQAEKDVCDLRARYFNVETRKQILDRPARYVAFGIFAFDIWSNRGLQVVWGQRSIRPFDQWLANYANAWLGEAEKLRYPAAVLSHFRSQLMIRVEHWRAEARAYVAEQIAYVTKQMPKESVDNTPKKKARTVPSVTAIDANLDDREKVIWQIIQRGAKGMQYCREVDNAKIGPRRSGVWKDCPRSYAAAYKLGKPWQKRIQDEKSKIRKKAQLAPALASE